MSNGNNSVGQGVGIGFGLLMTLFLVGMIPLCGCGGLFMVGAILTPAMHVAGPMGESRRLEQQRRELIEKREAEAAKGKR